MSQPLPHSSSSSTASSSTPSSISAPHFPFVLSYLRITPFPDPNFEHDGLQFLPVAAIPLVNRIEEDAQLMNPRMPQNDATISVESLSMLTPVPDINEHNSINSNINRINRSEEDGENGAGPPTNAVVVGKTHARENKSCVSSLLVVVPDSIPREHVEQQLIGGNANVKHTSEAELEGLEAEEAADGEEGDQENIEGEGYFGPLLGHTSAFGSSSLSSLSSSHSFALALSDTPLLLPLQQTHQQPHLVSSTSVERSYSSASASNSNSNSSSRSSSRSSGDDVSLFSAAQSLVRSQGIVSNRTAHSFEATNLPRPRRGRGRPKGSKNKPKRPSTTTTTATTATTAASQLASLSARLAPPVITFTSNVLSQQNNKLLLSDSATNMSLPDASLSHFPHGPQLAVTAAAASAAATAGQPDGLKDSGRGSNGTSTDLGTLPGKAMLQSTPARPDLVHQQPVTVCSIPTASGHASVHPTSFNHPFVSPQPLQLPLVLPQELSSLNGISNLTQQQQQLQLQLQLQLQQQRLLSSIGLDAFGLASTIQFPDILLPQSGVGDLAQLLGTGIHPPLPPPPPPIPPLLNSPPLQQSVATNVNLDESRAISGLLPHGINQQLGMFGPTASAVGINNTAATLPVMNLSAAMPFPLSPLGMLPRNSLPFLPSINAQQLQSQQQHQQHSQQQQHQHQPTANVQVQQYGNVSGAVATSAPSQVLTDDITAWILSKSGVDSSGIIPPQSSDGTLSESGRSNNRSSITACEKVAAASVGLPAQPQQPKLPLGLSTQTPLVLAPFTLQQLHSPTAAAVSGTATATATAIATTTATATATGATSATGTLLQPATAVAANSAATTVTTANTTATSNTNTAGPQLLDINTDLQRQSSIVQCDTTLAAAIQQTSANIDMDLLRLLNPETPIHSNNNGRSNINNNNSNSSNININSNVALLQSVPQLSETDARAMFNLLGDRADLHRQYGPLSLDSTPFMIVSATLNDMPIVYVNAGFKQLTGLSTQDVIGRNARILQSATRQVSALNRNQMSELGAQLGGIKAKIMSGREAAGIVLNYKKSGAPFYCNFVAVPVTDTKVQSAGNVAYFIGLMREVHLPIQHQHHQQHQQHQNQNHQQQQQQQQQLLQRKQSQSQSQSQSHFHYIQAQHLLHHPHSPPPPPPPLLIPLQAPAIQRKRTRDSSISVSSSSLIMLHPVSPSVPNSSNSSSSTNRAMSASIPLYTPTSASTLQNPLSTHDGLIRALSCVDRFVQVFNLNGDITFCSPSIERLLGHSTSDVVARGAYAFHHASDLSQVFKEMRLSSSASNGNNRLLFRMRRSEGRVVWIDARGHTMNLYGMSTTNKNGNEAGNSGGGSSHNSRRHIALECRVRHIPKVTRAVLQSLWHAIDPVNSSGVGRPHILSRLSVTGVILASTPYSPVENSLQSPNEFWIGKSMLSLMTSVHSDGNSGPESAAALKHAISLAQRGYIVSLRHCSILDQFAPEMTTTTAAATTTAMTTMVSGLTAATNCPCQNPPIILSAQPFDVMNDLVRVCSKLPDCCLAQLAMPRTVVMLSSTLPPVSPPLRPSASLRATMIHEEEELSRQLDSLRVYDFATHANSNNSWQFETYRLSRTNEILRKAIAAKRANNYHTH